MWPFYYDIISLPTIYVDRRKLEPSNKPEKVIKTNKNEIQAHQKIYRKQRR